MDGLEIFVSQRKTFSNLIQVMYKKVQESGRPALLPHIANASHIGDYATTLAYLDLLRHQGLVSMNKDKDGYAMALTQLGSDLGKYLTQTRKAE